jgi:hypothetical protein
VSTIGKKIDELYQLDNEIARQERVVSTLKKKRAKAELSLMALLKKEGLEQARGNNANARRYKTKHPQIKNGKKFWKYVDKHKAFDLVHNRIASRAYFDRLEEGEEVPGVEVSVFEKLSVTKRK